MRLLYLIGLGLVHLVALITFCAGFFPSKTVLQGHSEFINGKFEPKFNKLIVLVIDALRSDFIFSDRSEMSFVHGLINDGAALGFTAYSNPPTVTLPRLKGITTGSTPNFLDAVLNVVEGDESSSLIGQDSLLKQMKLNDWKIHMFGDDTWLKLFGPMIDESDGTSSFFVSDFTEVDNNVTRHLTDQLSKDSDWDCLILHYLGLDHIGHKGGPNSIFMKPKQKEMDNVIKRIYEQMTDDTLFVVLGDHGMNDIGNHGGSSVGETSAGLVFISNKLKQLEKTEKAPLEWNEDYHYFKKIQQIDLVPTISSLLHLPIPLNSLGIFIQEFLPLWNKDERDIVLNENIEHLKKFKDFTINDSEDIYEKLKDIQSDLTKSATNYNVPLIQISLGISFLATLLSILFTYSEFANHSLVFISFTITFAVTSFGSSLIEEEHQIWWWFSTLLIALLVLKKDKFSFVLLLFLIRIIRGWNTMGQKYVGDTIYNYLSTHTLLNWAIIIITISAYAFNINNGGLFIIHPFVSFGISFLLSIILITFKLMFSIANGDAIPHGLIGFIAYSIDMLGVKTSEEALVPMARMFFSVLVFAFVIRIGAKIKGYKLWYFNDLFNLFSFLLIFQTSVNNIGIYLILLAIKVQISLVSSKYQKINRLDKIGYITLTTLTLQHLIFFAFGQTNSLATVDLSNAYNGVSSYNILATGLLTFFSNFGGAIYWSFASLAIIFENRENLRIVKYEILEARWIVNSVFFGLSMSLIMLSCFLQRYHLFIWTVFSPKLLYVIAWNLLVNFAVEVLIVGVVALY